MDIRQNLTDKIILALEKGVTPWKCPFEKTTLPTNLKTKHKYSGVNTISLWLTSLFSGYTSNYWLGFAQARDIGGRVRKGEKGTPIIVCQTSRKKVEEGGNDEEVISRFFKTDYVFNADQIDGLEAQEENPYVKPVEEIDLLVSKTGANIRHQGERAYFNLENDFINMPLKSKFKDEQKYYPTLFHELIHWTGHKNRLDRINSKDKSDRAFEELIAEIGSSFLCAEYGISVDIENTASYVESWLECLKQDKNFIFKASGKASEAINYIQGI
ncbi:MAG TPA: zincin-like metallopeptidase domain-containing protein [Candidatus Gastranaerophilales bacterium]|nr:zincin-like metallopeptidase domain-containing protein [Candidatus Gastranaerophilales bacterium]